MATTRGGKLAGLLLDRSEQRRLIQRMERDLVNAREVLEAIEEQIEEEQP